jgi:ABC-type multidrug transport system fused ATPase/permease subunit
MAEPIDPAFAPIGTPDTRGPRQFLWWVIRSRLRLTLTAAAFGAVWMVPLSVLPFVVGEAIEGIRATGGPQGALVPAAVALVVVTVQALAGGGLLRASAFAGLHARTVTHRALMARLVAVVPGERLPAGDLTTAATIDAVHVEEFVESLGRTVGSLLGLVVVSVVVLTRSPVLGAVLLVGAVLAVLTIGPLMRPLRERSERQREEQARATALSVDIVNGLRVLRGIGGEDRFARRFDEVNRQVRRLGVSAGRSEATLIAAATLLPGLVIVAATWTGARLALTGDAAVGDVVAAFGASGFLYLAITNVVTSADAAAVATVAADRIRMQILSTPPPVVGTGTGVRPAAGVLTVVPVGGSAARELARSIAAAARRESGATAVLTADASDRLFSGPVGEQLRVARPDADLRPALRAAVAEDVVDDVLGGPDAHLDVDARSLSGGQRQRLVLARVLHADADVLVLDDPTGALDAYTEWEVCRGVAALRRGRTTVVLTESPSWRSVADDVAEPAGMVTR